MDNCLVAKKQNLDMIFNTTFRLTKKLAKDLYFGTWRKNPPRCPAFEGEIINISREGWNHLVFKKERTKLELLGRLFVLERARYLLETATSFQDYRRVNKTEYWVFEAVVEGIKIKVIVRSIEEGPKHFLSVIRKGSVDEEFV